MRPVAPVGRVDPGRAHPHEDLAGARLGTGHGDFPQYFREETGVSPGQWITRQRVLLARELLESTDLNVDQVAGRAGFVTAASLRQHLHAAIGVAPLAYRRTFQAADQPAYPARC